MRTSSKRYNFVTKHKGESVSVELLQLETEPNTEAVYKISWYTLRGGIEAMADRIQQPSFTTTEMLGIVIDELFKTNPCVPVVQHEDEVEERFTSIVEE